MGCTEQLVENISGYSKAKYSTWLFYRPDRLLFDAGEGVSTSLGNFVYGVEHRHRLLDPLWYIDGRTDSHGLVRTAPGRLSGAVPWR